MDFETTLLELAHQGFECSQILMLMALEIDGKENPDLIRAMSGLCGGMGRSGGACGVLTGGCCVLGYFTGQGEAGELAHSRAREMISEYAGWFHDHFGTTDCRDIIHGDFSRCLTVCVPIIEEGYFKLLELLGEYGILEE